MSSAVGDKKKIKIPKKGVKRFQKQKQKVFRANEPFISVFMWGVNHSVSFSLILSKLVSNITFFVW